jgi:hypothetical protein
MSHFLSLAGIAGYATYCVGSYAYKGGKSIYNLATTRNGVVLMREIDGKDIPDRFKCSLTGKVMNTPVVCPGEAYFDQESIHDLLGTDNHCPVHGRGERLTEHDL